MGPGLVVLLASLTLVILLMAGVSVSISLASSGVLGLLLLRGPDVVTSVLAGSTYSAVAKSSLIVVPMFIFMGMLMLHSGIAEQLFAIASRLLSWLPGSLGISAIFAAAGFGAISGSSIATVATLGRTCITEMMRHGYQRSFASATVAASGTLAVLIPPSVILVLYGVITNESIGALLLAGIIPGILSALVMAGSVAFRVWRRPELVSQPNVEELALALATVDAAGEATSTSRSTHDSVDAADTSTDLDLGSPTRLTTWSVTHALGSVVVLFTIVIGGLYSGIFTPTESAAVGALAAFLLIVLQYARRPAQLRANLAQALKETASLNAMIFLILVGAGIFSFFLVSAGAPAALSAWVITLPVPPSVVVMLLLVLLIPLGMFLDSVSLLVITVPLVYGPITDLGFDGIWLGILVVKLIEIGMITPPVGLNAYVAAGTVRGLEIDEVFRGLVPFFLVDLLLVATLFAFPALSTWLPTLAGT
jgi:TRAP-type C4-dicarboxylate transport system permease large subunit